MCRICVRTCHVLHGSIVGLCVIFVSVCAVGVICHFIRLTDVRRCYLRYIILFIGSDTFAWEMCNCVIHVLFQIFFTRQCPL